MSLSNGKMMPITIAETIKIQSLRDTLNIFCKMNDNNNTEITTHICAASIPKANSTNGKNLFEVSGNIILKYLEKPNPWITPKNAVLAYKIPMFL